tara:strand:- start:4729 stop:6405 length:1677 start_codon:yes stop_codon:yes gene_type:complete
LTYIGLSPPNTFTKSTSQTFTGNGSTTAFTLQTRVASPEDLEVFVSNVQQQPTESYTIGSDGVTMTFSEAPPSGTFYVIYRTVAQQSGTDTGASRLIGDNTFIGNQTIVSTDAGASAEPTLTLYRNSASPVDADVTGSIDFKGRNDNSQDVVYSQILSRINDATDNSEDGRIELKVKQNGTLGSRMIVSGNGNTLFSNKNVVLNTGVDLVFEGATGDANETTLTATDPTADRTITLPNATGTVALQNASIDMNGTELILDADADTSITADTDDQIDFKAGNIIRASVNTTGLQIGGTAYFASPTLTFFDPDSGVGAGVIGGRINFHTSDGTASGVSAKIQAKYEDSNGNTSLCFETGGGSSSTEKMKLTSTGELQVNGDINTNIQVTNSKDGSATGLIRVDADASNYTGSTRAFVADFTGTAHSSAQIGFQLEGSAGVKGSIVSTGNTTCSYVTSSDERLKTDIEDLTDGLATINKIKPRKFKWISEGEDAKHDHGFVAQELHEDYDCRAVIVGGDDPLTDPWSVDASKLVPMLVKALQEADAKTEALTLRVKSLEEA